jgi:hypothetical protein
LLITTSYGILGRDLHRNHTPILFYSRKENVFILLFQMLLSILLKQANVSNRVSINLYWQCNSLV